MDVKHATKQFVMLDLVQQVTHNVHGTVLVTLLVISKHVIIVTWKVENQQIIT